MWFNINRNGRLGNRLFSRAHVYAAAIELGETVVDWGLLDVAAYFPRVAQTKLPVYPLREGSESLSLPDSILANRNLLAGLHLLRPRNTGSFGPFWSQHYGRGDAESMRLDNMAFRNFTKGRKSIILNGFKLRCTDWVHKHKDAICKYFELPQSLRQKWSVLRTAWLTQYSEVIGIHMRLTDFQYASEGRYILTASEYAGLIRERTQFDPKTTLFVIFSDEKFWNNERFREIEIAFAGLTVYVNQGDLADDLCGLMACDRIIGPATSTFSRWAAFAGDREWAGIRREFLENRQAVEFVSSPVPWDY
jgi:hypothetical protein